MVANVDRVRPMSGFERYHFSDLQPLAVLERNTRTKLYSAHRSGGCDAAKVTRRRGICRGGGIWLVQIHVVENVRPLCSESDLVAFAKTKVSRQRQVDRMITGSDQEI